MKIAGSSRKDGILFVGPKYQVNMVYKDGDYSVDLKKLKGAEMDDTVRKIPGLRGMFSIFRSSPALIAGLGLQLLSEAVDEKSRWYPWIITADGLLTGYLLWKIAGDVQAVRRFHGAEHKVINAQEQQVELDYKKVRKVSRIARRCGTNFIGFYLVSQLVMQALPLRSQTVKTLLAMGLAYEGFRLDPEKYSALVEPFYKIGEKAQQFLTTAEPGDSELKAAVAAMKVLVEAETAAC